MAALMKSVAVLTLLAVPGCTWTRTSEATATEQELCLAWRDSLPTRSRQDTEQTKAEIGRAYDVHAAACPAWAAYPTR